MRVLIVGSRFPLPGWRGNQVRTGQWLRALEGCSRSLVCPAPERRELVEDLAGLLEAVRLYPSPPVARALGAARGLASRRPLQEEMYRSRVARRAVREAISALDPEVVVVQMVRCGWAADEVLAAAPGVAILFDAIDAMGAHFRRAAATASPPLREALALEARRCRRREGQLVGTAAVTTAVCRRDLEALAPPPGRGRIVPVAAREAAVTRDLSGPPTVLLSGNLGYRPTVAAARWFARRVWPELRARVPEARFVLAGARPHAALRRLVGLEGLEVHGDVPDLAPFFGRATVAVAPMRSGSGLPIKILEAWSAGVPVVADPWAADGLDGDGREAVAVAATCGEWVDSLVGLLSDRGRAATLGERGREVWRKRYRFGPVADAVRSAVTAARDLASAGPG